MKRNRKGEMPQVTREIYKGVKRFDRQQFEHFCRELYGYGFEDGRESVPGVDVQEIYRVISQVKGIGPSKLAAVREAVDAAFGSGGGAAEKGS